MMKNEISKDDIKIIFFKNTASIPVNSIAEILNSTSCRLKKSIEKPSLVVSKTNQLPNTISINPRKPYMLGTSCNQSNATISATTHL